MTFHLEQHEGIAPGLRRIAHEQIGSVLTDFSEGQVPLGTRVHSLRACCKKMRSLLRLVRPVLGDSFDSEDQRFRAAAKELAEYRDSDIVARTVLALGSDVTVAEPTIPADAIERALQLMTAARDRVDRWPLGDAGPAEITAGFTRTYLTGLESWHQVQRERCDENFHTWRKWTKYQWYQVRILERANEPELRRRRWLLWKLQRALGEAHDLVVLESRIDTLDCPEDQLLRRATEHKKQLYAVAESIGPGVFAIPRQQLQVDVIRWCSAWR